MSDRDRPCCGTCPYWFPRNYAGPDAPEDGECRRHPPQFPHFGSPPALATHWPETDFEDICGEHPDFALYVRDVEG